jgi:hypothetical protein
MLFRDKTTQKHTDRVDMRFKVVKTNAAEADYATDSKAKQIIYHGNQVVFHKVSTVAFFRAKSAERGSLDLKGLEQINMMWLRANKYEVAARYNRIIKFQSRTCQ